MAVCSRLRCILVVVCFVVQFVVLNSERVLGTENEDFDFDGLPGVQHEFKVDISGGIEECFFQKAQVGAKFYISFEVLRGGDRNIDVFLRNTQWELLQAEYWKSHGWFSHLVEHEGTFALCFDNTHSRFAGKLVYVYLAVYVIADWTAYGNEIQEIKDLAENFSVSLSTVDQSLQEIQMTQSQRRLNVIRDWYLIWNNNRYVQTWSIAQCVVIVTASVIQVFFVRRLFRTTNVTPSAKPRA